MKQLFKFAAILLGTAMTLTFAGCNDGDGEVSLPAPEKPSFVSIGAYYSLTLDKDWYELWDIRLTYTGKDGQTITETFTEAPADGHPGIERQFSYTAESAPRYYEFKVTGIPKATAVEVNRYKIYLLNKSATVRISYVDDKGNSSVGKEDSTLESLHAEGSDRLQEMVLENKEIYTFSHTIE